MKEIRYTTNEVTNVGNLVTQKKLMSLMISIVYALLCSVASLECRSPFRTPECDEPYIEVRYINNAQTYYLRNSYIRSGPLFNTFDKASFFNNMLPAGPITYRYDNNKTVEGKYLVEQINSLLTEISQKKQSFTHFKILKNRDFRRKRDRTGLLIAKFKDYPFVLKLFIETPHSFIQPYKKGFEPCCFFIMAGGTRHLNGFTRIPNLHAIKAQIAASPEWRNKLDVPRKWYWQPNNKPWMQVKGYNLGGLYKQTVTFPAVYAIIADEIAIEREFTLKQADDRITALKIANFFEQQIDPHINNYVIEKGTGKIVPIDYEFFPSVVGLKRYDVDGKKVYEECRSYPQWYGKLACKMVHETFFRTKAERREAQYSAYTPLKDY